MRPAIRRTVIVFAAALTTAAAVWALAHAGSYLQHEDTLRRADAIFVLAGTRFERALEAADLYHEGYAPAILLSPGQVEPAENILRRKGIDLLHEVEQVRDALVGLGIPRDAITVGVGAVDNTAAEAKLLREVAAPRGWRVVIVVTSKYHTRRAGFAMRRGLAGAGITVVVRASRYDPSDPAHWWRHRGDIRRLMQEWPKVLAYRLGLSN
jgi:uncharacterized SAM-binding protein YcdF (DUF218 family)